MNRVPIALACVAGLTACEPTVTSSKPLVSAGAEIARPGLWAMLEEGCAAPRNAAVQTWPACATPFWISSGELTVMIPTAFRVPYVLSSGRPMIAQFGPDIGPMPEMFRVGPEGGSPSKPPGGYEYKAVAPEGASPFTAARVWDLPCLSEAPPVAGLTVDEHGVCEAHHEQALRTYAAQARGFQKAREVVWVAPG